MDDVLLEEWKKAKNGAINNIFQVNIFSLQLYVN